MQKFLTDAQLKAEVQRCEYCETKPCKSGCPADCSPADFIMAIKEGAPADYQRAANLILAKNPLGGTCGAACFSKFCQQNCVKRTFDRAIEIPKIQAEIIRRAKELNVLPKFAAPSSNGKAIAIVGAGPAGLAAAAFLAQEGYSVTIYEQTADVGGTCNKIAAKRLPPEMIAADIEFIKSLGAIDIQVATTITNPQELLKYNSAVIVATGKETSIEDKGMPGIFFAGDCIDKVTHSIVEAVASGKNAALLADAFISAESQITSLRPHKSDAALSGAIKLPVSLETEFFGIKIKSPFLLSAGPHTDGYIQMKLAYEAGWAGGVMKTAFDGVPIHIPDRYMFRYDDSTYANCDNVSAHSLERVCEEVARLVREYPEHLTMASTGGSVSGEDVQDKHCWQANTRKLEQAGAKIIEYSLSCPQGAEGAYGAIASQDLALTAKIIDWVMEISDPNVPKLFKLTAAISSAPALAATVKKVLDKYSHKKAGITFANSFPNLTFRPGQKTSWEDGIITGMAGAGMRTISFLALANIAKFGLTVSGNCGLMNYKDSAHFLALGAKTLQYCTIVMKYGLNVIQELESGLSHLLAARGYNSVGALTGCALPQPVANFMELPSIESVPAIIPELCQHCGNCTRCGYRAATLDANNLPTFDATKCVGCSICVQKCFAGALYLQKRK